MLRLWDWLSPPKSYDDEQARVGLAVKVIALSFLAVILPQFLLHLIRGWMNEVGAMSVCGLGLIGVLWLNRRGHSLRAAQAVIFLMLACITSLAYFSSVGYHDQAMIGLPCVLAAGSLLLSRRDYVVLAALSVVVAATLVLLQTNRLNPNALNSRGHYSDALEITLILAFCAVTVGMLASALKRGRLEYRNLIRQLGEGVIVLSEDRRIQLVNPAAAEIFGVPAEELNGRFIQEFIPDEEWPAIEEEAIKVRAGERVSVEITGERPDGTRRKWLATVTPRDAQGRQWLGSVVVLRDVTLVRQAEERVRLLAHALRSTDDCVCIADMNDCVVYVNDAFLRTYGYQEAELLGRNIGIVRSRRNPPGLEEQILPAALRDGWSGTVWNQAKDGREFQVSLTASVVRDERGTTIATVGVARDLTARKAVEDALKESERRFQELLQHVNIAGVMVDTNGIITFINNLLLEVLGRRREEVVGRAAFEFVAPESRDQVLETAAILHRDGQVEPFKETAVLSAGGKRRWFLMHRVTLRHPGGAVAGLAVLGFETTDVRALREQFLQAQKLESIGRLAGGVAHDFNNLLTVINGFAGMLLGRLDKESPHRRYLEQILTAGEQAVALTRQLLSFSRKQASTPQPLDLNRVIAEAKQLLDRVLGKHIEFRTEPSSGLGLVMADANQMHQVLMNLAVNARDAMIGGGTLVIGSSNVEVEPQSSEAGTGVPPGSYVRLDVTDTGTGMTEEVQRQIFEPFFTTKAEGEGTGLGLSTVYGIVRQHGGEIRVRSELGKGTTFHIFLPRLSQAAEERAPARPWVDLAGSETVLLVEDEQAVRRLAQAVLDSYGYRVLSAASGPAAIAVAEQFPETIHLLLTGLVMPGMDGKALARNLRASRPEMKVLYMSGYAPGMGDSEAPSDSAIAYLAKPFEPRMLATKVRQMLAGM